MKMFASLFRNVDNKLPVDMASHLISKDTECSWSHPRWNWRPWGKHDAERTEVKDFKGILGN